MRLLLHEFVLPLLLIWSLPILILLHMGIKAGVRWIRGAIVHDLSVPHHTTQRNPRCTCPDPYRRFRRRDFCEVTPEHVVQRFADTYAPTTDTMPLQEEI